jgi:hypothetical protein
VHSDDEFEIRHVHLGEGLVAQHASVVDENVDASPQPFGACNHLGDLRKIGDVRIVRDRRPAGSPNLFHNPHGVVEAAVLTEIIDDDVRSARRKSQSMRTSKTGASAGDDGHFAFKVDCHKNSPRRRHYPWALLAGEISPCGAKLTISCRSASGRASSNGQIALPSAFARTQPEISQSPFGTRRKL